jgi:hypothetical protein
MDCKLLYKLYLEESTTLPALDSGGKSSIIHSSESQ